MINFFKNLKKGTEYLNYGREIILNWIKEFAKESKQEIKILDIGCGIGEDLINIKNKLEGRFDLYGIENYGPYLEFLQKEKIKTFSINIEREKLPFKNNFFDVVIANQVLEHTKEIFWIISEISRVLKPNGALIIGVPNLASLHNRILLFIGKQPASIEILSAHVRGFTRDGFIRFIQAGGCFEVKEVKGANFYPFPPLISRFLSKLFPNLSVGIFFLIRAKEKSQFDQILTESIFETNYLKH